MLTPYLIFLALGGTFIVASLVLGAGADSDADHDLDVDHDVDAGLEGMDADADADVDGHDHDGAGRARGAGRAGGAGIEGATAWLPITSIRFWTFFSAFLGLTGAVLTVVAPIESAVAIAVISTAVGYACGLAAVATVRALARDEASSSVSVDDLLGATGRVMVPPAPTRPGKVRLELGGRIVEMLARTEDDEPLASQDSVIVYALGGGDHVMVTRTPETTEAA